jgi:hypothetical protein
MQREDVKNRADVIVGAVSLLLAKPTKLVADPKEVIAFITNHGVTFEDLTKVILNRLAKKSGVSHMPELSEYRIELEAMLNKPTVVNFARVFQLGRINPDAGSSIPR